MNDCEIKILLNNLEEARNAAGAEFGRLCNDKQHIDACVFQSIRDSIKQSILLLESYLMCKSLGQESKVEDDTLKAEDDTLKAIMFDCTNRLRCKGCRYLNNDTIRCRLVGVPAQWRLE